MTDAERNARSRAERFPRSPAWREAFRRFDQAVHQYNVARTAGATRPELQRLGAAAVDVLVTTQVISQIQRRQCGTVSFSPFS